MHKQEKKKNQFGRIVLLLFVISLVIIGTYSIYYSYVVPHLNASESKINEISAENLQAIQEDDILLKGFEVIDKGDYSGVTDEHVFSIKSKEEFLFLWEQAHVRKPIPEVPEINFSKYMIIAVFLGEKEGAYSIDVENITTTDDSFIVLTKEYSSVPENLQNQTLTRPYEIIKVLRIDGKKLLWKKILN